MIRQLLPKKFGSKIPPTFEFSFLYSGGIATALGLVYLDFLPPHFLSLRGVLGTELGTTFQFLAVFFLAVLAAVFAFWQKDKEKRTVGEFFFASEKKGRFSLLLFFFVPLFLFACFYPSFVGQEIPHLQNLAQSVAKQGLPKVFDQVIIVRHLPYVYLLAFFYKIFGVTSLVSQLPGILFAVLTFLLLYKLLSRLSGQSAAVLASALLSFSGWFIAAAGAGLYSLLFFFLVLALFSFLVSYQQHFAEKSWSLIFLAASFLALLTSKAGAVVLFLPLAAFLAEKLLARGKVAAKLRQHLIRFCLVLSAWVVLVLAFGTYQILPSETVSGLANLDLDIKLSSGVWPYLIRWFPLALPVIVVGFLQAYFSKQKDKLVVYLFFLLPTVSLFFLKVRNSVWGESTYFLLPTFYAVYALGLVDTFRLLLATSEKKICRIFVWGLFGVTCFASTNFTSYIFELTKDYDSTIPLMNRRQERKDHIYDFENPARFVKTQAGEEEIVVSDSVTASMYLGERLDYIYNLK
ncbi:MAG: glycosyltransferase family 39 protein, partial [Patescibacteria group bacterium]